MQFGPVSNEGSLSCVGKEALNPHCIVPHIIVIIISPSSTEPRKRGVTYIINELSPNEANHQLIKVLLLAILCCFALMNGMGSSPAEEAETISLEYIPKLI